ncbi:uncharacterized protein BROUX77_003951 [Berkeleyomyces rouxiae]|uniref:uncharacterized protein n=1 Tax=Berkeleyomyces rouxiae TaxID=2035830 RepID=UPI003B768E88
MRFSLLVTLASATLGRAGTFKRITSDNSFDLAEAENVDWMAKLPNNIQVTSLSIPGTHNSVTNLVTDPSIQTQNTDLATQLRAGIRYIDVSASLKNGKIAIYHRGINTTYDLETVLTTVLDFIDENPREGIFIRIRKNIFGSGTTVDFESAIRRYLTPYTAIGRRMTAYLYKHRVMDLTWELPRLKDIRGRIIILQDFPTERHGLLAVAWNSEYIVVSDWKFALGKFGVALKWFAVKAGLTSVAEKLDEKLHITHVSAGSSSTPYQVAGGASGMGPGMNDRVANYLTTHSVPRTGIIVMDFPGKRLVEQIISHNNRIQPQSS